MKARYFAEPAIESWRQTSIDVLTSDAAARHAAGPKPPTEWAPTLHQLTRLLQKPVLPPQWWTPMTAFFGSIETRTHVADYHWDGMKRLARTDAPLFAFQLTLAGFGHFQSYGQPPRVVLPGTAFIALVPSRHRYYLPKDSPGWTFSWISVHHPYLLERMKKLVAVTGPLLDVASDGPLAAITVRLVRGAIKKDFRDRFEAELALFEFLVACERSAQERRDSSSESQKLLQAVRARVLASLPRALDVTDLAEEYGMSRSHFSHFFRSRTGLSPARYASDIRIHEAIRMLLGSRAPLKEIADACGFANANYFCKAFRRLQHMSPDSYRRSFM